MSRLVARGATLNARDHNGNTTLHVAASKGHCEVCSFLLSRGVDVEEENKAGRGSLHLAAVYDRPECTALLAAKGAWLEATDGADETPLLMATRQAGERTVRALIDAGANVDARSRAGLTPLAEAVLRDDVALVDALLEAGADVHTKVAGASYSHVAAAGGSVAALRRLRAEGLGVGECDNADVATPLHAAARAGRGRAVEALLDAGAEVNAEDADGCTALDHLPQHAFAEPEDNDKNESVEKEVHCYWYDRHAPDARARDARKAVEVLRTHKAVHGSGKSTRRPAKDKEPEKPKPKPKAKEKVVPAPLPGSARAADAETEAAQSTSTTAIAAAGAPGGVGGASGGELAKKAASLTPASLADAQSKLSEDEQEALLEALVVRDDEQLRAQGFGDVFIERAQAARAALAEQVEEDRKEDAKRQRDLAVVLQAFRDDEQFQADLSRQYVREAVDAVRRDPKNVALYTSDPVVMRTLQKLRKLQEFCKMRGLRVGLNQLVAEGGFTPSGNSLKGKEADAMAGGSVPVMQPAPSGGAAPWRGLDDDVSDDVLLRAATMRSQSGVSGGEALPESGSSGAASSSGSGANVADAAASMANVAEIEDDGQEPAAEAVARVAKETSAASTVGEGSRIMSWREWWWKSFSQLFITCLYQSIFMLVVTMALSYFEYIDPPPLTRRVWSLLGHEFPAADPDAFNPWARFLKDEGRPAVEHEEARFRAPMDDVGDWETESDWDLL